MPNNNQHLNELELRSEAVQDIMNKPPVWLIRSGNNLIFLIVIGLFALAFFIKYPDVVVTDIKITTTLPPLIALLTFSFNIYYCIILQLVAAPLASRGARFSGK